MSRKPREKSSTGIYHVMVRGVNRQDIFHCDKDREKYISIINKYKEICQFELYGYCLMGNHVHLLVKEGKQTISQVMQRMGTSYAYWHNQKYERTGHLFQGRFKSEIVEDDRYLLVVLRYIHQNPTKAGLVKALKDYKWSSYSDYVNMENTLTDIHFVLNILDSDKSKAVKIYKDFMLQDNEDRYLDIAAKEKRPSDGEIKKLIVKYLRSDNISLLQQINKTERNKILRNIKKKNASIRQLARVTGLGRKIIEKA